jgi:uncharacterized SAM-binding protein YcdF (DUF218 family)
VKVRSFPGADPAARPVDAAIGALLGGALWLECMALGLPAIVSPGPGYNFIPAAVLGGALLGLTRARRLLWPIVATLAALIAVMAGTPVVRRPAYSLIRADSLNTRPLDAVIVLSNGITADGHLRGQALDRLLGGLSLVRRGAAQTLMLSRIRVRSAGVRVTSDADQQRLIALLERPPRVLIVDSVYSTRDEAVRMRALARPLGITNVAVVTSPIHTRRSCATFEKVGFAVTCVPSESRDFALHRLRSPVDRMRALQLTLYEWAALAMYRTRGWV